MVQPVIEDTYLQLFLRFLRFGCMAFGGPFAQIAMIRNELVDERNWVSRAHFNRVLAIYQVLPGPEAHELCVYFGTIARGRIGGILAGLGFMLPGFIFTVLLSWLYTIYGLKSPIVLAMFAGCQSAVAALIFRASHRIGQHALSSHWLWVCAILAGISTFLGLPFWASLIFAAGIHTFSKRQNKLFLMFACVIWVFLVVVFAINGTVDLNRMGINVGAETNISTTPHNLLYLFIAGLRGGLLTFGGAYTAIPFVQNDAVVLGRWMTNAQFLDGLAMTNILPTPLVMFVAFVGFIGAGFVGACAMVCGMFLPAFAFTLIGHDVMERLITHSPLHAALDGVTAAVVGIVFVTAFQFLPEIFTSNIRIAIFIVMLILSFWLKTKWSTVLIMLISALLGLILL